MAPFTLLGYTETESTVLWAVISNKTPITQKELAEKTQLSVGIISLTLTKGVSKIGLESKYDRAKKSTVFFANHLFREKTQSLFLRTFLETLKRVQAKSNPNSSENKNGKGGLNAIEESINTQHIDQQITQSIDWIERSISLSKWE